MSKYAALLIGASAYDQRHIPPLGFVRRDIELLADALRARGAEVEAPGADKPVSANFVNGEVTLFLRRATAGQRLVIVLSGHGLHAAGRDYLVPEDFHPEVSPIWSGCVEIDWRSEVENTRAAQVLFLIDACREGVDQDVMGAARWSSRRVQEVADRKVAYMYACSPGEVARYVGARHGHPAGGDSFSIFSRAVTEVLAAEPGRVTLEKFRTAVQSRIDCLYEVHRKHRAPQRVRVLTSEAPGRFVLAAPVGGGRGAAPPQPQAPPEAPSGPGPTGTPPAGPDREHLLAQTLHQVLAFGRTDTLEEFAARSDPDGLIDLSGLLDRHEAAETLWERVALRRTPDVLLALAERLSAAGHRETPERLMCRAAAVRPPEELLVALSGHRLPDDLVGTVRESILRTAALRPVAVVSAAVDRLSRTGHGEDAARLLARTRRTTDLPELLIALQAYGRGAETDALVRRAIDESATERLDEVVLQASGTGTPAHRAAALEQLATRPVADIAGWAARAPRAGTVEDIRFVARAMAHTREDWHELLPRLRALGAETEAVRQEFGALDDQRLMELLDHLIGGVAEEDASAIVRLALTPFRATPAVRLLFRYRQNGGFVFRHAVLDALTGAGALRTAEFLRGVEQEPDLFDAAGNRLIRDGLATEIPSLARTFEVAGRPDLAAALWQELVHERPVGDVVEVIGLLTPAAAWRLLGEVTAANRTAAQLAELVEMPGRADLAAEWGGITAEAVVAGLDGAELFEVLAVLLERGEEGGADRLLGEIGIRWATDRLAPVVEVLAANWQWERAGRLLRAVADRQGPVACAQLMKQVPGATGQRFRQHLGSAFRGCDPDRLLTMATTLLPTGTEPVRLTKSAEVHDLLLKAVAGEGAVFAELLRNIGAKGPEITPGFDLVGLVGRFLSECSAEQVVRFLGALRTDRGLAPRVAHVLRQHAVLLLRAVGAAADSEEDRPALLRLFCAAPPLRPFELAKLLERLRASGLRGEAAEVRDRLLAAQPPAVMAALLYEYRMAGKALVEDLTAICGAGRMMSAPDTATLLEVLEVTSGVDHWFVGHLALHADPARVCAVVVELIGRGSPVLAAALTTARPWEETPGSLGGRLVSDWNADRSSGGLAGLAAGLEPEAAGGVFRHLVAGGASDHALAMLLHTAPEGSVLQP